MDFDPEAGELVAFDTTVIMDMTQQMEGTVQTPDGEQQVDMEIITRDMKVNTTVEKVE
jgi:ribosome maturation factor RimP